jgi:hypothetical protein
MTAIPIVPYQFQIGFLVMVMVIVMAGLGHSTQRSVDGMVVIVPSPVKLAILAPIATSHFPITRHLFRNGLVMVNVTQPFIMGTVHLFIMTRRSVDGMAVIAKESEFGP